MTRTQIRFQSRFQSHFQIRTVIAGLLMLGLLVGASSSGLGSAPAAQAEATSQAPKKKVSKQQDEDPGQQVTLRLPRYFASIIDDEQRTEIQRVQSGYQVKITALQQELAALEAAQMKELEGLLTSSQRKKLDEMRSATSKSSESSKTAPTKATTKGSRKTAAGKD